MIKISLLCLALCFSSLCFAKDKIETFEVHTDQPPQKPFFAETTQMQLFEKIETLEDRIRLLEDQIKEMKGH